MSVGDREEDEPRTDEQSGPQRDGAGETAEELAGQLAGWVARAAARAREEAEDVWAEARELRRRW
jgi:hypothetical protein